MNLDEKQIVRDLVAAAVETAGSQNSFAKSIQVSSAQVSNLLSGKWDAIGDTMWRKFAKAVGFTTNDWITVETRAFKQLRDLYLDAREHGSTFAVVGDTGIGKTDLAKWMKAGYPSVFHLECSEFWNKKAFLSELLKQMGCPYSGYTIYDLMVSVEREILKRSKPLIIIDEVDKLKDDVLYFFITLYNRLDGSCGIVMQSTPTMRSRVQKGVQREKRGFSEIFSRIGRRFIALPEPNSNDITLVCRGNGLSNVNEIQEIIKHADCDLRRVKRLVHATKMRKEVSHAA